MQMDDSTSETDVLQKIQLQRIYLSTKLKDFGLFKIEIQIYFSSIFGIRHQSMNVQTQFCHSSFVPHFFFEQQSSAFFTFSFFLVRAFKFYSQQISVIQYRIINIVITLHVRFPDLIHLITRSCTLIFILFRTPTFRTPTFCTLHYLLNIRLFKKYLIILFLICYMLRNASN